jgi:hypothetical protein
LHARKSGAITWTSYQTHDVLLLPPMRKSLRKKGDLSNTGQRGTKIAVE